MIKKIKHIGVAVDDLQTARDFFQDAFDLSPSDQENFGELIFSFIPMEGTHLELLHTSADGVTSEPSAVSSTGLALDVDPLRDAQRILLNGSSRALIDCVHSAIGLTV